jgi:hypothetical protein
MPLSQTRALEILKSIGAGDHAESYAKSEARGPFVARYLLLRGMWACAIDEDDRWQKTWFHESPVAAAIERLLAKGIDPADLTDVVRAMQVETLFNVCQLLDNPGHGIEDLQEKIPENIEWRVAEYDGEKERVGDRAILDIHESFHSLDPTGREGQPRDRFPKPRRAPTKKPATSTKKPSKK